MILTVAALSVLLSVVACQAEIKVYSNRISLCSDILETIISTRNQVH